MENTGLLRRIVPEAGELIERRYLLLQHISFAQPVGRRALAAHLDWAERMVRKEMDFLRRQGLIVSDPEGMRVTAEGEEVLRALREYLRDFRGISQLERELERRLVLKRVTIVPGDSDLDPTVKKELARATAQYLQGILQAGMTLAVTGGTTLAEVAESLPPSRDPWPITVVPARGGLGEEVELQANSVAARIAQRLGAQYRLLHIPDDLGEEAVLALQAEPRIRELLDQIKRADVLLHGIGSAEEMARRRGLPAETVRLLRKRRAVGEAFGFYFDREGRVVYTTSSVGIRQEDVPQITHVVAVGGGRSKAEASLSVISTGGQDVFITDEGAARTLLEILEYRERSAGPLRTEVSEAGIGVP
ncbi:sugar-binding transcriptional regulator [Limnochorda pilosa]|uniref:DeoR family transcriptional regulator n=1 Tax=Limnochorda pilosa TaxID=1555112 RepID=A0A0K2SJD8_LIMPI|nr:sugar-binding domain-containing protein [Limnochorda pilosa]BAS27142.1 DeoR family transcriptional regulator [Limnochorda pilosa]